MFCPNCGRDNSQARKYCASCGTNLDAVSRALTGDKDDFFTKTDAALDQLIARYAEHVFKDASSKLSSRKVSDSWKILGQGVVTTFVDMVLFSLMWNILPLRFFILLISTPFRLLSRQGSRRKSVKEKTTEGAELHLPEPEPNRWLSGSAPSVIEHTTQNLEEPRRAEQQRVAGKD